MKSGVLVALAIVLLTVILGRAEADGGCELNAVSLTRYAGLVKAKDGVTVWDVALKMALSEHSVVAFPKGDYKFSETIRLGSGRRLEADKEATIGHAPTFDGVLVRNELGAKNIQISGGIWYDHPRDRAKYGDYRNTVGDNSQMFRFLNATDVTFRDLCVSNAPTFSFQAGGVTNLLVENIRVVNGGADGIHLNGWMKNVLVRNVRGDTGDDIVALNAWDWPKSTECYGPSEDVTIEDVQGSYGAIRLLPGKIRKDAQSAWLDCAIRRVVIRNCRGLAAVKASFQGVHSPNQVMGSLSDILFENLEVDLTRSYTEPTTEAEKPGGRGHFAAFEFGSDAERVKFRNVTVNFHADKYPCGHFLLAGPWWWEKSISPVVKDVRVENFTATGIVPAELYHETVFDSSVLGAEWSGRGRFENVDVSNGEDK